MTKNQITTQITVKNRQITVKQFNGIEYISLTDLARRANADDPSNVIMNWMSNKNSFDFYGLWEELNNPNFNSLEFHRIKIEESSLNRFTMTPRSWKARFNAIGIIPSAGRYSSGTFAHPDIAFEFASWLSPEFKLYLIREFERLKKDESYRYKIEWKATRLLSKANYSIHTDAIKSILIPELTEGQRRFAYANEADILNVALFGMTAAQWREQNPDSAKKNNIRDSASLLQLIVLNNLEVLNSEFIKSGLNQENRLTKLNAAAREQIELLKNNESIPKLSNLQSHESKKLLSSQKGATK